MSTDNHLPGLADRPILVTGAANGIGQAIAMRLADAGARVILSDTRRDEGEQAAARIEAAGGIARFIPLDVADEAQWTAAVEDIAAHEGGVRGLVNNAGIVRYGTMAQTSWADWTLLKRIMLDGMFLGTRAFAPQIAAAGGGAIVNVASIHALAGAGQQIAYAAVKAAARIFSRSAALEWADRGVRINTLLPGPTATAILDNMPEAERAALDSVDGFEDRVRAAVPLRRLGEAADLAACAAFLLSDAAGFMVGADMVADGGVSA